MDRPLQKPWFWPTDTVLAEKRALVIGGGIAGTSSARALAEEGYQVTLVERHSQLASEASGNRQAVLYARLSAGYTPAVQWSLAGFSYTLKRIRQLLSVSDNQWDPCGVIQLAVQPHMQIKQQRLMECAWVRHIEWLSAEHLSDKAGIRLDYPGLWFPQAGWVDPQALCRALAHHHHIHVHYDQSIERLDYHAGIWSASTASGQTYQAPVVVIAGNHHSAQFRQTEHVPLIPIRGQVTGCKASPASQPLQTVLCHEGYIMPSRGGQHTLGATFNHKDRTTQPRLSDHLHNLQRLQRYIPALGLNEHLLMDQITFAKVGFRCTTPDYLPIVGPVANRQSFEQQYARLSHDAKTRFDSPPEYYPGLFINTGHGAKGMITAPLCAQLLAAQIQNQPLPVSKELTEAVHPNRFLIRRLIRSQIRKP